MKRTNPARTPASEPFHLVLTSAARNLRRGDWELTHRQLCLAGARAPWAIRQRVLHGGRQEGAELIEVDNGRLRLAILPTRGMGILKVECDDVRLGWDSPVEEVVHPRHVNLSARGGLGWLEGFNEWLVRCGLESMGAPGRDEFVNAAGHSVTMDLPLHGKIANLPASEVEVVVDRQPPHRLRVRGLVKECGLFGPRFELWTEVSTALGEAGFQVDDLVTNRGGKEQEFQLLYHVNYGPPLLEAGARFAAPLASLAPVNDYSASSLKTFDQYLAPTAGFAEQVYCLRPLADARGETLLLLRNAAANRAASIRFAVAQMPCVTLWKNTAAPADGYVTGLEPGTGFPLGRQRERAAGRVPRLAPGESRRFSQRHEVLVGEAAVQAALAGVQRRQGRRVPKVEGL